MFTFVHGILGRICERGGDGARLMVALDLSVDRSPVSARDAAAGGDDHRLGLAGRALWLAGSMLAWLLLYSAFAILF